ncbi:ATP synthase subunit s-like protein [Sinocyclocheilus grahami]|uniref:Distal membrane-arm assembly complex protein 2 n=1 Tax=Sinocyclocheilus grahami TaxID=75366 RepID=A0A672QXH4_SINGR|nr:PREDICTED: ATP synthase subunit s-like protein [Sinocyclocheilus grahami]
MAASLLSQAMKRCSAHTCAAVAVRRALSSGAATPSVFTRFLLKLNHYFYDVENILDWNDWLRSQAVIRKNRLFGYAQKNFGKNVAAAYYILTLRGSFRFAGQSEWFRPDSRGRFSYDFMNTPDAQIEEVDLSATLINHNGLENLVKQNKLQTLSLRGCPEVDDWLLARLHVFGESLVELDLSHCSRITVGGLAALQNLRKLERLDISGLPRLQNPGLVRILLEEMLPHCQVSGAEYEQGLIQPDSQEQTEDHHQASTHTGLRHL